MEPLNTMYKLTTFSVDTRFADQYYAGTADFLIRLPSTIRNVVRINLSSVEIPLVAYAYSAACGNVTFWVNGSPKTIPDGNYTPATLAGAFNTAAGSTVIATYDASANRYLITGTGLLSFTDGSGNACSTCNSSRNLGYFMGFRPSTVSVVAPYTTTASPVITPPPYMLLQVMCPDTLENTIHRVADGGYIPALAKLIFRNGFYTMGFDDNANLVHKQNVFQQPTTLTQMRVRLLDAYGNLVDMGDTDWSVAFEITDIVQSCKSNELRTSYARC